MYIRQFRFNTYFKYSNKINNNIKNSIQLNIILKND